MRISLILFLTLVISLCQITSNASQPFLKINEIHLDLLYLDKYLQIENNDGKAYQEGQNYNLIFNTQINLYKNLVIYLNPELKEAGDLNLLQGYLNLKLSNSQITLGKKSLWWGPGKHGSMLLSNNIEPFLLLKLSNDQPIILPWAGKLLGDINYSWLLTRLEEERVIPYPYLTGLRINFSPSLSFNFSLNRVIIFGGQGRESYSFSDYWKMILASHENETGKLNNNQLAGFDFTLQASNIKFIKSFWPQGEDLIIYGDFVGEDEAGSLPCKWGRLGGISLTALKRRVNLTLEYADNSFKNSRAYFYTHDIYQSGYTYQQRIIGHHMGGDAEDFYLNLNYQLRRCLLELTYDLENKGLSLSNIEKKKQYLVKIGGLKRGNLVFSAKYGYQRIIKDKNNLPSPEETNQLIYLEVKLAFF
ncbi:capsule assembly Wzi family protein [bacterium]|nr:capsule assembly Wzi family protein [bacterium]